MIQGDLLAGVRILDLSRLMPFSYATQLLVEAGAEVVKVEQPGGEYGRGMAAVFASCNRGKKSVTLDLRQAQGRELLLSLVPTAHVLLQTFRPGFLNSLGLGPEDVRANNPRLVYCSASGYGRSGPYAGRPGHDINYAALAGLLSPAGGPPVLAPVPYVDMASGLAVAYAMMMGLVGARTTGQGCVLDVGMSDVALSLNILSFAMDGNDGGLGANDSTPLAGYPWPGLMRGECPCYGIYETADGEHLALGNVEPKFWRAFLGAIERPDLETLRFSTGAEGAAAIEAIQNVLSQHPLAWWLERFQDADICFAPVNSVEDVHRDRHVASREVLETATDGTYVRSPVRQLARDTVNVTEGPLPIPAPGEHNAEILGEIGHDADDIKTWSQAGIL